MTETASLAEDSSLGATSSPSITPNHIPSSSYHRGPWTRKPLHVVLEEQRQESATFDRHLTLIDLLSIGVGGTIGSGVFVLTGFIAHHYAGPATTLSFAISGLAALCSGLCYAELAGRIPAAGSTYIYAYISLGEWAAVIAAACLTLEYGVSGAAVARSWGDKVVEWLTVEWRWEHAERYLLSDSFVNPLAGLVSASSVALLLYGVKESKRVTNFFTSLKIGLVIFMSIGGLLLFQTKNLTPWTPHGVSGVLRGATSSFFGYLGYDEVCCVAAEAKNPQRDMPRAVLLTLAIVTILYITASFALVGTLPYQDISDTSGFPAAFQSRGIVWAAQLTAAGEVITLPVVVLISLMAQPRLQSALARDGLLPPIFGQVDHAGNLKWGCLLSGVPMTLLATFVPFAFLDDLISVGILIAFCMTNTSLILMRCESPIDRPNLLPKSLALYHILAFVTGLSCHWDETQYWRWFSVGSALLLSLWMYRTFPATATFGGSVFRRHDSDLDAASFLDGDRKIFQTPLVPLIPCMGISINWYLVAQLEPSGMVLLTAYLGLVTLIYLVCCRRIPFHGWRTTEPYEIMIVDGEDNYLERDMLMLREFSLPKR